jgi:hypothetical protein
MVGIAIEKMKVDSSINASMFDERLKSLQNLVM